MYQTKAEVKGGEQTLGGNPQNPISLTLIWLKTKEIHCRYLHVTVSLSTEKCHGKVGG